FLGHKCNTTTDARMSDQINFRTRQTRRIRKGLPSSVRFLRSLKEWKSLFKNRAGRVLSPMSKLDTAVATRSSAYAQRRGVSAASSHAAGHMIQGNRCWND